MVCFISYENNSIIIPFTYNDYFNTSIYNFLKELNKFENSKICPIAYNSSLLSIFTDLFSIIEQIITSIYTITYYSCVNSEILSDKESKKLFRRDYKTILSDLFKITKNSDYNFKQIKMFNKLAELEDIRNYILHGNIGSVKISKTKLPTFPLTINYEDIMEELDIIINLVNHFRYILPDMDFMPNIYINIDNYTLCKKFDIYYYNVLVPYMNNILQKHQLTPSKKYKLELLSLPTITKTISKSIKIIMKSVSSINYNMNQITTNLYNQCINKIILNNEIALLKKNNAFQICNFTPEK